MSKTAKYLQALRSLGGWVEVSEWAQKVGEMFPEILEEANQQAAGQARETTGVREIAARIHSRLSRGRYAANVEADDSSPKKVRYVSEEELEQQDLEEEKEFLTRNQIIKRDWEQLSDYEQYRVRQFQNIADDLKYFGGLEFELDHAEALLNSEVQGGHHPDNLQFLQKAHNAKKSNKNWSRFTLEEQLDYIRAVVAVQSKVADRLGIKVDDSVLQDLLERLAKIYN